MINQTRNGFSHVRGLYRTPTALKTTIGLWLPLTREAAVKKCNTTVNTCLKSVTDQRKVIILEADAFPLYIGSTNPHYGVLFKTPKI